MHKVMRLPCRGSKPKGMQLCTRTGVLFGGPVEAVRWGGDPMCVNADADDYHHSPSRKFSQHANQAAVDSFGRIPAPPSGHTAFRETLDDENP
jgi:hypothetical protein